MYEFIILTIVIGIVIWQYPKIKEYLIPRLLKIKEKYEKAQNIENIKQQMDDLEQSPKAPISHLERWNQILMDFMQLPYEFITKLGISYGLFSGS